MCVKSICYRGNRFFHRYKTRTYTGAMTDVQNPSSANVHFKSAVGLITYTLYSDIQIIYTAENCLMNYFIGNKNISQT